MSQRTPSMQEALRAQFEYMTADMYTSIPGIVVSVDNQGENRITVKPTLNIVSHDLQEVSERPAIINVAYHQPQSRIGGLSFPVQTGDPVMLIFSMRGLDTWKQGNGYPVTPLDRRKFDIRDCIAVPGVFPFSESPNLPQNHANEHDPEDVVLVHNLGSGSEVEIRLKRGTGDVLIKSPGKVTVDCEEARVEAKKKVSYKTIDYEIDCVNYKMKTINQDIVVENGGVNTSTGTFRMNGSFILNGIPMEAHVHQETNSVTQGPQNP